MKKISATPEKRVAVMQPYLFPYIGYFNLIHAVDEFIFLDDVQYPKSGWVNRNKILVNGSPRWFTAPVAHTGKLISEKNYLLEPAFFQKLKRTISRAYSRSSRLEEVLGIIDTWESFTSKQVSRVNADLISFICKRFLGLNRQTHLSSQLTSDAVNNRQTRIISLVREIGGTHYLNPPGGAGLYSPSVFLSNGITYSVLQPNVLFREAHTDTGGQIPLSILDLLLRNSEKTDLDHQLSNYEVKPLIPDYGLPPSRVSVHSNPEPK